jgi:predicted regulator of Ras-like GTPase activity (Roadblock/LC7/MglB family)
MPSLQEVMEGWSARAAVVGAAVIGDDGLLIHDAFSTDTDAEAVAALAATLVRDGAQLGGAGHRGDLRVAVLDYAGGPAILAPLLGGATLVVLAAVDHDLGPLLYELRTRRDELARLV